MTSTLRTTALAALAVGVMVASTGGEASASTVGPSCSVNGITISGFGSSINCAGAYAGNDSGNKSTVLDQLNGDENGGLFPAFSETDLGETWVLFGKFDIGKGLTMEEPFKSEGGTVWASGGDKTGTFSATGLSVNTVISVKAGSCYALFLFSPLTSASVSGSFDVTAAGITSTNPGAPNDAKCQDGIGSVPGLSHITVFVAGEQPETPPPSVVPLPAAGWLLLGGLGALGAVRRRRKAA